MTGRQFNRLRKWDKRVAPAYQSGCADGWDAFGSGRNCPEPLLSDYDTKVYLRRRMRSTQEVVNATIARSRGRYDGWRAAALKHQDAGLEIVAGFEALLRAA